MKRTMGINMSRIMRAGLLTVLMALLSFSEGWAQCAMCRATLENNYSNGNAGIAAGINTGILYLLSMPYLAVMILGYLWYKSSRHARKELSGGAAAR